MQTTYVMLRPFAAHAQLFYLDRPRNTHTLYLQNRLKRRHAAMAYVCSSITAPHTAKKRRIRRTQSFLRQHFSSPAKKSSRQPLNFHQRNQALRASFDVFYIITLSFCRYLLLSSTYTLSAPQNFFNKYGIV